MELNKPDKPVIGDVFNASAYFDWHWPGFGFGQLSFGLDPTTETIHIANECMTKETVRKILHAYVDHIVDVGILDHDPCGGK